MPDTTARLGLPIMAPAQAQKHVTHNEALLLLDGSTQLVLDGVGTETPPITPVSGETHFIGPSPTGLWAQQAGAIAQWQNDQWRFQAPREGWRAWDVMSDQLVTYKSGNWISVTDNLEGLGIGTSFDDTNRLSLASPASLFSHAGAGHQLKVNKATSGDTASLLFQSNWTGHAEMGLSGDTQFRVKVSADGGSWTDAIVVDASTGHMTGAAVQASATETTSGKLARADFVYGPGNLIGTVSEVSGVPTGAVIEQGTNALGTFLRFADGTQICTATVDLDIDQASGGLYWSGAVSHDFPMPFASKPTASGSLQSQSAGWVNGRAESSTAWSISGFAISSATGEIADVFAMGRWY